MREKLEQLLRDTSFTNSLLSLTTTDEIRRAFAEKGVDLPEEALRELTTQLARLKSGELSADDLSDVAGGFLPLIIAPMRAPTIKIADPKTPRSK